MTAGRIALAIVTKAPQPGEVKTRLCPPLTPADACELHRCFLLDKIEQVRGLRDAAPAAVYAPAGARGLFEELAPGFALVPQREADLGGRLIAAVEALFAEGFAAAVMVDSDTPTLPAAFLQQAIELISAPDVDLVLGPSEDGGYYLIGLRAPRPDLFENMPWSSAALCAETIRRARASGLRVACLPEWFDVDTASDLARLRVGLATTSGPEPRHTRRFLSERMALAGSG